MANPSALIGVKRLAHEDLMVEIECMAVIPTERFKPTNSDTSILSGLRGSRSREVLKGTFSSFPLAPSKSRLVFRLLTFQRCNFCERRS